MANLKTLSGKCFPVFMVAWWIMLCPCLVFAQGNSASTLPPALLWTALGLALVFILVLGLLLRKSRTSRMQAEDAVREWAQSAEQLRTENENLFALQKEKEEYLARIIHELQTPLNGIIGLSEGLLDGAAGEQSLLARRNLGMVISSGKRLASLVGDILDSARLLHQKLELHPIPLDLSETAEMICVLISPQVRAKGIQLINSIPPELPPVMADHNRLQQILHNLVGNAVKFTSEGKVELKAVLREDPWVEITVEDTGIGIPEDKFDQIFLSFKQADDSIARRYGGTGLGLAITQSLVKAHGGRIWVESRVGQGSQFHFTLPLATPAEVALHHQHLPSRSGNRTFFDTLQSALTRPVSKVNEDADALAGQEQSAYNPDLPARILIVDDEVVNLQVLRNHLAVQGYEVEEAMSGEEALRMLAASTYQMVIMDVMMQGMSGYECCRQIRLQFPANELPVILVTARNQVSDLLEGFGSGANDYLTKPVSKYELLARIRTHLSLARIHEALGRFVPQEFLHFLEKDSLADVKLGDHTQMEMTILFADIRNFTRISEQMGPEENFQFLNSFLSRMEPNIVRHHGFIDKYIGDSIMALFHADPDDALRAAIDMQLELRAFNQQRRETGQFEIQIGIGINTGMLMLGTIGGKNRMDGTVISDAVNLASRVEGMTKFYGGTLLITEETLSRLANPGEFNLRMMDKVRAKGKDHPVVIYEVIDGDLPAERQLKLQTLDSFERGVEFYLSSQFEAAKVAFREVLKVFPDPAASLYITRCNRFLTYGLPEAWDGVTEMPHK